MFAVSGAAGQHPGVVRTRRVSYSASRACGAAHGRLATRHLDACSAHCYLPAAAWPETAVRVVATGDLAITVRTRGEDWMTAVQTGGSTAGSRMEANG
jgi:hypothetical protein